MDYEIFFDHTREIFLLPNDSAPGANSGDVSQLLTKCPEQSTYIVRKRV
jgi:hypothetical protein